MGPNLFINIRCFKCINGSFKNFLRTLVRAFAINHQCRSFFDDEIICIMVGEIIRCGLEEPHNSTVLYHILQHVRYAGTFFKIFINQLIAPQLEGIISFGIWYSEIFVSSSTENTLSSLFIWMVTPFILHGTTISGQWTYSKQKR